MTSPEGPAESHERVSYLAAHPVISSVWIVCVVSGIVLGGLFLPEEWLLIRRLAGGGFAGAGIALLLTGIKMIG